MKTKATISSKGQLTLPKEVRARLGVEKGDEVEFTLDDRGVYLRPKRAGDNPFLRWIEAGPPTSPAEDVREARHAGLSAQERALLAQGPGARVVTVADLRKADGVDHRP